MPNTHSRCNICLKIGSKGYFRFPTNKKELKKWLVTCGLPEDTVVNRSYFICYRHFALEKCLTNVLEEFMDELSKISVEAVGKPSEPPSKAAKIIQSVTAHGLTTKVTKLTPKIPLIESEKSISVDAVEEPSIIDSKETEFVKQELPAEIEQNLSDFKKFPEPSPSISQSDNENPENVIKNVGHELRDEHHQYKELIEIKDELALHLEDSNLISDYQAWSKFPENEESGKPIIEDIDVSPAS